jgi:outer membrane lipoprotein SlyB
MARADLANCALQTIGSTREEKAMTPLSHQSIALKSRMGSRWALGAVAAGLVAAGALAGGLMAQYTRADASSAPPVSAVVGLSVPASTSALAVVPAASAVVAPRASAAPKAPVAQAPVRHKEPATEQASAASVCAHCGVVESVRVETRKGQPSGVGAVAGGLIGGLLGNQFGKGDGRKVMTVAGAVGGGLAGNELEKQQRAATLYVAEIRMDDGSLRSFTRSAPIAQGARVQVQGQQLRLL